jgi:parallel beta-helix repeat protein
MATITGMTSAATTAALALKADDATVVKKNNNLDDVQDKSIARSNLNLAQRYYFDIRDFGAVGDGVADDTNSINNALTAANTAGGGTVFIPHGTYKTTASLIIPGNNILIRGESRASSKIKPATGSNDDVISTAIPVASGTAGYIRNYIGVETLTIDGSQMTGTTAGKGNGIHFYGVQHGHIRDVMITSAPNWGIVLDGDTTNFSYRIEVTGCRILNGAAGILATFSDEDTFARNIISGANANTAATQPAFDSPDNVGYQMRIKSGFALIEANIFGSGGTTTTAALQTESSETNRIIGNRFDQCRYQAIRTAGSNNVVIGNEISNPSSVGSVEGIRLGSNDNIVIGNFFDTSHGAAHYTYCVYEPSSKSNNNVSNNYVIAGTSGAIHMDPNSVANRVQGNVGYNPIGYITPPTVPASSTLFTNNYGTDATVYITGGTVNSIIVGGGTTNLTSGTFRVCSGQTITLLYTSAPSWRWFLD